MLEYSRMIGGLVGYLSSLSTPPGRVTQCSAHCDITVGDRCHRIGGLIASAAGTVSQSLAQGNINAGSACFQMGGLIALGVGEVNNTYAATNIVCDVNCYQVGGGVGSLISSAVLKQSYAIGQVITGKNSASIGGLVGYASSSAVVEDCFWDLETTLQTESAGGTGLTTAAMQNRTTYQDAGWDFVGESVNGTDDLWKMSTVNGYPFLTWPNEDRPTQIIDDFENGNFDTLPWQRYNSDAEWKISYGQSQSGRKSAQAGLINDDETSTLSLSFDCAEGDMSFFVKVSSESGYDMLIFRIDGEEQDEWSGEVDWTQVAYPVSAGSHSFEWEYAKDSSESNGNDTAWIDDIVLPMQ